MMRPDELHTAMRADLVCILKDVVGLIARIEATLPSPVSIAPQLAPFPGVQNEGSGIHGDDQRAQKEEAGRLPSAGAAKAGIESADRRNSSREAGEVALAPPAADRTPVSDQPTDVAPPSVVTAEPPAASSPQPSAPQEAPPTKTEQVLDIWSTTDLTDEQIAAKVGCAVGSVQAFVSQARKKNDPRGFARKLAHDHKLSEPPSLVSGKPVLIKKTGEREPPVSGFAKPVERKPFEKPKSKPYDPRPGRLVGIEIDVPGSVIALDMKELVAVGPKADWKIGNRPVTLIMERMRNGETFADEVLAELGSMGAESFRESRKRWAEELANIGVNFVHTPLVGCRIEVAK